MRAWRGAQFLVLLGFGGILLFLPFAAPGWTDRFWYGVVPILPLVFLLAPAIWRNVCPLATLGNGGPVEPGHADLLKSLPPVAPGVIALFVLIALRPVLFEADGVLTAGLLLGAGGVAFWKGREAPGKSGFCNRICPVLAVERLLGQSPLIEVGNARCGPCDLCGPRGCLDLSPRAALPQLLAGSRHSHSWTTSPFGVFAGAFPGIVWVFAWIVVPELRGGSASTWEAVPLIILAGFGSWLTAGMIVRALDLGWRVALPTLAGLAAGLHLWGGIPMLLQVWGIGIQPAPIRWGAMVLVAAWWLRALDSPRRDRLVKLGTRRAGTLS